MDYPNRAHANGRRHDGVVERTAGCISQTVRLEWPRPGNTCACCIGNVGGFRLVKNLEHSPACYPPRVLQEQTTMTNSIVLGNIERSIEVHARLIGECLPALT